MPKEHPVPPIRITLRICSSSLHNLPSNIESRLTMKRTTSSRTLTAIAAALLFTIGLVGCGKKDPVATQVVAKVDGEEISVHQINQVLSKTPGITQENLSLAKQEILNGLVDQQLAINMALSKKLDRTPEVVAAMESAKREILARAAVENITSALPKPTDDEVSAYYAANPSLFSARKIFNLRELAIGKANVNLDQLRAIVASGKSLDDIAEWLKAQKIEFTPNAGSRSAEQIPLEILPLLAKARDGQVILVEAAKGVVVTHIVSSKLSPVTEAQAANRIKSFLFNSRSAEAVKAERAKLKSSAKIEFLGEFSGGEAAVKAKAEAEAKAAALAKEQAAAKAKLDAESLAKQKEAEQAAAQAEADARAKARAEAREQAGSTANPGDKPEAVNLEKGLKGLKQ